MSMVRFRPGWRVQAAAVVAIAAAMSAHPSGGAIAQMVREHDAVSLRSFHGGGSHIRRSFESDQEAKKVLSRILAAAGLAGIEDRITLRASAETPNAEAFVENKERFIFYNAVFMQEIAAETKDYWSMVAILAHEVGHHIRFHTVIDGRAHEFELEADYQAGFILRRMGATLANAQTAFRAIGPDHETKSHPARAQRLQAATLGWTDGGSDSASGGELAAKTPPPAPQPAASAVSMPTRIIMRGDFGAGEVLANLTRGDDGRWTWTEDKNQFRFRSVSEQGGILVIHDPSRDMYHHIDVNKRQSWWRVGSQKDWNRHMDVIAVD